MSIAVPTPLKIPPEVVFSDLGLQLTDVGISFRREPLVVIGLANGANPTEIFDAPPRIASEWIASWYLLARAAGEPADAVAESLLPKDPSTPYFL